MVFVHNNKIVETTFVLANGLYRIIIRPLIISNFALSSKDNKVSLWHKRLGHPGSTLFRKVIPCVLGHDLQPTHVNSMVLCQACVQGKLIAKPSLWKLPTEFPPMLPRIYGDICGPINPMFEPFKYFLVLVDASGKQSHISLLSIRIWLLPIYFLC
jgi:hypothetical protein